MEKRGKGRFSEIYVFSIMDSLVIGQFVIAISDSQSFREGSSALRKKSSDIHKNPLLNVKAASNNVIPAKAGIQNLLKSLDSCLRGSDKLIIIRGSLKAYANLQVIPPSTTIWAPVMYFASSEARKRAA